MENKELDELRRKLEHWRGLKNKGRLIPEEIWQGAVVLARELGVTRVHQELKLGFKDLKKRMGGPSKPVPRATKVGQSPVSFVRLSVESSARVEACVLKIESASGARLQVELSGIETSGLSQLVREFAAS